MRLAPTLWHCWPEDPNAPANCAIFQLRHTVITRRKYPENNISLRTQGAGLHDKMASMVDVLTPQQRSFCMSRIRAKDTKPEILVRKGLFALGFRFRLHPKNITGSPDVILPKYHAAIFVHGCLWHGHGCHLFKWPQTNGIFWRNKINKNKLTDSRNQEALRGAGWRVLIIWECALRGRKKTEPSLLLEKISHWLQSDNASRNSELPGY